MLRKTEAGFRAIIERSPDGIYLGDIETKRVLETNEAFQRLLGYSSEELVGMHIYDIVAADPKDIDDRFQKALSLRGEVPFEHERTYRRKDGSLVEVWVRGTTLSYQGREVMCTFVRDITERKQVEEHLRDTTCLLETILDCTPMGVAYMDPQFNFIRVNRAYAEADERECSFFLGKNHFDLYPNAENEEIFRRVVETGKPYFAYAKPFEYAYHPERGVSYWDWSLMPIRDPGDAATRGLVLTVTDVTDRIQAQETLRESEEWYRAVMEQSGDAIHLVDAETKCILEANRSFAEMLGYASEEIVGLSIYDFIAADREDIDRRHEENLRGKAPLTYERQWRRKDGSILDVWVTVSLISHGGRNVVCAIARDVTERKRAEAALRGSEEKYRTLFEESRDTIYINTPQGKFIDINSAGLELFGYSKEEMMALNVRELYANPDDRRRFQQEIERGGFVRDYDIRLRKKDGTEMDCLVTAILRRDKDGRPLQYQGIIRDITERERMEEELQQSEERYRAVVEQSADAIYLVDVETKHLLEANAAFQKMLGYSPEELVGISLYDFIATDPEEIDQRFQRIRMERQIPFFERLFRRKDGSLLHVWVSGFVAFYGGREVVCGTARDLTAHKQVEEALRQSEERYRAVVEQSPDGIFLEDAETRRILEANRSFRDLLGYSSEELAGLSIYDIVAADREDINRRFRRILRSKGPFTHERKYRRKDGSLVDVWLSSKVISYGGKRMCCSLVRDISERRRTEELLTSSFEEVRRLAAHLQSAREEERTLIAQEIHDELAQSLTALKFDLSWLQKRLKGLSSAEDRVQPLLGKIGSMTELTDTTIKWARKLSRKLRPALLDDLGLVAAIEWEAKEFQARSDTICRFVSDIEDLPLTKDQSTALFRIAQESLTNVARHAGATKVTIRLRERNGMIILRIRDNGRGITEEARDHPKSFGLLGMRERCLVLGGKLHIHSYPGKGTTITVEIPLKRTQ